MLEIDTAGMSPSSHVLTHWGRVTHICVSELTITGSDNGLSPGRRQAIIWNNAGLFLIEPLGTNVREISIGIQTFTSKKMHLNMSSAKWRPLCLVLNVLIPWLWLMMMDMVICSYKDLKDLLGENWIFVFSPVHVLLIIEQLDGIITFNCILVFLLTGDSIFTMFEKTSINLWSFDRYISMTQW